MKKLKVQNISDIKLDFFLKQNDQDVRVCLEANEDTWCDGDSNTKSMILYERKNLIKISDLVDEVEKKQEQLTTFAYDILPTIPMENPDPVFLMNIISDVPVVVSDVPIVASDIIEKEKKTVKGKRRGPKKKRGPKPGAAKKKKKLAEKLAKENKDNDSENLQDKS